MFSSPHLLPPELCRSSCFGFCFNLVANFVTALEKTILEGITNIGNILHNLNFYTTLVER